MRRTRMIVCALCGRARNHQARGLCGACYVRAWTCGMIEAFALAHAQFLPCARDGHIEIGRVGGVVFYAVDPPEKA